MNYRGSERLLSVDVVRTMGMILVICFHVGELYWSKTFFYPESLFIFWKIWSSFNYSLLYIFALAGDHGVPLFIFMSGYLIAGRAYGWNHIARRIWKLWQWYAVAVLLAGGIMGLFLSDSYFLYGRTVTGVFMWQNILWSLLLVQSWRLVTFNSPLPSLWFIPILLQLYVLYGLFLKRWEEQLSEKQFLRWVLRLCLGWNLFTFFMGLLGHIVYPFYFSGMSYIGVFGVGMWWAHSRKMRLGWWSIGLILLGWILRIVTNRWFFFAEILIGWGWFEWGLWIAEGLRRWPGLYEQLARIGRYASYHVYLWHQLILFLVIMGYLAFIGR